MGVISASGIIKCRLRLPQSSSKKRKSADYSEIVSKGTATRHYLNFLKAIMDEMDTYERMKKHYLIMDNGPIHKSEDISRYI